MTINGYPVVESCNLSDPTLALAASEMAALSLRRFGATDNAGRLFLNLTTHCLLLK